jgi:hypothetical protein
LEDDWELYANYVNFIGESVSVAEYVDPFVAHASSGKKLDKKLVSVSKFAPGVCPECVHGYQFSWITNEAVVRTIGANLANTRLASQEYTKKHHGAYKKFPSWDEIGNGWQTGFRTITIPDDDDNFGLIHGDLHTGNFMLDQQADKSWLMTTIDFDNTQRSWYMIDLGTVVFQANLQLMSYVPSYLSEDAYNAYLDQFKYWITDEYEKVYGKKVDPAELTAGCQWRQDFLYTYFKMASQFVGADSDDWKNMNAYITYYDSGNMLSC